LRVAFAVGGEPALAVPAALPHVFGLGVAEYEQSASLFHPCSLWCARLARTPTSAL
jgi:hypothetical protein